MKTQNQQTIKKIPTFALLLAACLSAATHVSAMDILVKKNKKGSSSVKTVSLHKHHGEKGHLSHEHKKMQAQKNKINQKHDHKHNKK